MGKTVKIAIEESEKDLERLLSSETHHKTKLRIRSLLYLKKNKFRTQQELANHLGITRRCLSVWLKEYRSTGLKGLLPKITRNKPSKLITPQIHEGLKKKLNDASDPLQGYWDAKEWVSEQYGVDLKYHWLRKYLITHFKTKLKQARKSHIKKDDKAVEAFLKTA